MNHSPDLINAATDKIFYTLTMFPYPSGSWLHCGHASVFTINDIIARFKRLQWYTVFNPIGFDAFWLPTENFALKTWKNPRTVTDENKAMFLKQIKALNLSFDYERVIDTSMPDYYKWTQRIFLKLYEAGLVYKKEQRVNRDPIDQTVLANSDVLPDGTAERSGAKVIQKLHSQWFIKITDYADRLIDDLDLVDRPAETKTMQKNRIGRSVWAEIEFQVDCKSMFLTWPNTHNPQEKNIQLTVFTTRPDTIYGVTALVLAPENTVLDELIMSIPITSEEKGKFSSSHNSYQQLLDYRQSTLLKTPVQRQQESREKSGIFSWLYATHPLTGQTIPIWFADYVLPDYGSGAVMLVPAHDQRDRDFATRHGIPKIQVIKPIFGETEKDITYQEKSCVYAILHDPKTDRYAVFDHGDIPWWEIKQWEELLEVLTQAIAKKTGYTDITVVSNYVFQCTEHYCAWGEKNVHRRNHSSIYRCTLNSYRHETVVNEKGENDIQTIKRVSAHDMYAHQPHRFRYLIEAYTDKAWVLINSWEFDGLDIKTAQDQIIAKLETMGIGKRKTTFRLRDWSVSRQRYRWSPIPMLYDANGNIVPVDEKELPVILPLDLADIKPKGKSPLEDHPTFKHQKPWYTRECDTLDTFMCSSFYFLRYPDAHNPDELIRKELRDKMFPIDLYSGGKEHTVWHLLYSRFIHKFLYDQGYVSSPEPFAKLVHQGMVLGADGRKMGKRYGNWVDPLEVVEKYGSDAVRTYLMFMGPVEQDKMRSDETLHGTKKYLDRVARIVDQERFGKQDSQVDSAIHTAIQGITYDMNELKLNTAVSKLMIATNAIYDAKAVSLESFSHFVIMLSPFAPILAQHLWEKIGKTDSVESQNRPIADESKIASKLLDFPIQINGKMRGTLSVNADISQDALFALIQTNEQFSKYLNGQQVKKIIFVKWKIMNIILG